MGDEVRIVIDDGRHGRRLVVGRRAWRVLDALDGTRDLEGVIRAAGLSRSIVEGFLERVVDLGLTSETKERAATSSPARDLPLVPLADYAFRCTGIGACCATGAVLFTPLEAARARAHAPDVMQAGEQEALGFTPHAGLDRSLLSVAMRDGACAYLDAQRRCSVYEVRPHGCRTFPSQHVDVGHEIRVGPRLACACELEPGDVPLTSATHGSQLPPALWVETLPEKIRVGDDVLERGEALAWSDALRWPRARVLEAVRDAADALVAPPLDRRALEARMHRAVKENAWRAPSDLLRCSLEQLRDALGREHATNTIAADEHLAARALTFLGGLLVDADAGATLRRFEARLFLARRLVPDEVPGAHPIAIVNGVARAIGL